MISFKEFCRDKSIREDWGKTSPIPKEVYDFPDKVPVFSRDELQALIKERIERDGVKADLNDIDVSNITDMSDLFRNSKFNGDISKWDVSNVKDMTGMFDGSDFNGDISGWNVGKVKNMRYMFDGSPRASRPPKWYKE